MLKKTNQFLNFWSGDDNLKFEQKLGCFYTKYLAICGTAGIQTPKIYEITNTHNYFGTLNITVCITILYKLQNITLIKKIAWDGCIAKLYARLFPFRSTLQFNLNLIGQLLKIEGNSYSQLFRPMPKCQGSCVNNFDNRLHCYAEPDFHTGDLYIYVGFELFFIKRWKKIYERFGEQPECKDKTPEIPSTRVPSETTTHNDDKITTLLSSSIASSDTTTHNDDKITTLLSSSVTSSDTTTDNNNMTFLTASKCSSNPCLNNGTCIENEWNSYKCTCPIMFNGTNCENLGFFFF